MRKITLESLKLSIILQNLICSPFAFQINTSVDSIDKHELAFYNSDINVIVCLAILDFTSN